MTRERNDIEVSSAGVGAIYGQAPSAHSVEVLRPWGIDITRQRSQPLTEDLVEKATVIFAMTRGHLDTIHMLFPEAAEKTYLVCEFQNPSSNRVSPDVPDPIGQGLEAYLRCRDTIHQALPSLLKFIDQTMSTPESATAPSPTAAAPAAGAASSNAASSGAASWNAASSGAASSSADDEDEGGAAAANGHPGQGSRSSPENAGAIH